MKSKYLVILSSLIILMLSLSVVSAAIANGEDNTINKIDDNSDVKKVDDGKSVSKEKVIDEKEKVASNNDKTEKTVAEVKSEESDDSPVKVVISASYSNKEITAKVVDKATNKPLANVNVHMDVHADSSRGLVKIANAKTNSKGYAIFSVNGLKADNYQVYLSVVDKKYESNLKEVDFTIKKQPVNPTKKVKKNKPKKTNPVDMRNTGIPILGLVLVVFAIFGVGYRKY